MDVPLLEAGKTGFEECFLLVYSTALCFLEEMLLTGGKKATNEKILETKSIVFDTLLSGISGNPI